MGTCSDFLGGKCAGLGPGDRVGFTGWSLEGNPTLGLGPLGREHIKTCDIFQIAFQKVLWGRSHVKCIFTYMTEQGPYISLHKLFMLTSWGFPGGSDSKESTCNSGDLDSIPGSGRSPWRREGYLLQYSCLENSTERGAWWATVHGVTELEMTEVT